MKLLTLLLLTIIHGFNATAQNSFAGDWEGKIGNIRLIFHLTEKEGKLTATLDSPDQGATGLACDEVTTKEDSINITLSIAHASYSGLLGADKKNISGTWKQGGQSIALDLSKGASIVSEVVRWQTPKPPFPYRSEEVTYDNKDKSVHYGGTLSTPNGAGPFPAVVIISGSGTQDRDGTMFGHKSYAVLADYLTRQGIAVLRVDDRGIGKSSLGKNPEKLTSVDFAADVATSFAFLQNRPGLNKKRIGLIGHSEGGMIAPIVASKNKSVAFIVLLAGPGQKGDAIWKYQMQQAFERPNLSSADKLLADQLVNAVNDAYKHSDNMDTIQSEIKTTYTQWKKNVPDSVENKLLLTRGPVDFLKFSNSLRNGLSWLKYFMNYDPAILLAQIKIPVLAINGEQDIQVLAKENLAAIDAALKKGNNKKYTIKAFPNLNHLFQTTTDKERPYNSIDETFSPIALAYIAQWIKAQ